MNKKKVSITVCVRPEIAKLLKELKKKGSIESVSSEVRDLIETKYKHHDLLTKKYQKLDKFTRL